MAVKTCEKFHQDRSMLEMHNWRFNWELYLIKVKYDEGIVIARRWRHYLMWYCTSTTWLSGNKLLHDYCFHYVLSEEEFEDTNGGVRIRKSKKYRQHNGQQKNDKRTWIDLQNMHLKTKDVNLIYNICKKSLKIPKG